MTIAAQRRFWNRVAALGCMVTGGPAEICHVVGKPSVTERIHEPKPKGAKLYRHGWLVIPLTPELHRLDRDSLDLNPAAFEARYGPVAAMVDRVQELTGVPVWELSQVGRKRVANLG